MYMYETLPKILGNCLINLINWPVRSSVELLGTFRVSSDIAPNVRNLSLRKQKSCFSIIFYLFEETALWHKFLKPLVEYSMYLFFNVFFSHYLIMFLHVAISLSIFCLKSIRHFCFFLLRNLSFSFSCIYSPRVVSYVLLHQFPEQWNSSNVKLLRLEMQPLFLYDVVEWAWFQSSVNRHNQSW